MVKWIAVVAFVATLVALIRGGHQLPKVETRSFLNTPEIIR